LIDPWEAIAAPAFDPVTRGTSSGQEKLNNLRASPFPRPQGREGIGHTDMSMAFSALTSEGSELPSSCASR
jgi:hypothetical protein